MFVEVIIFMILSMKLMPSMLLVLLLVDIGFENEGFKSSEQCD